MGKRQGGLAYLRQARPEALENLLAFSREAARHLDPKTRNLIALVTQVIEGSPQGVEQEVRSALDAGATPDEVIDAVLCASASCGLARVVDAVDVILELDLPGFAPEELRGDRGPSRASAPEPGRDGGAGPQAGDAEAEPGGDAEGESPDALSQRVIEEGPGEGWHEVGGVDELEGGRRLRVLAGTHDIALFRVRGRLHAVGNRCPHAGGPLSEGFVDTYHVVCPLHAWRFRLDTGACTDVPGASVPVYEVHEAGGKVWVRIP